MLLTLSQANAKIQQGAPLIIAGSRPALAALQPGNWIGGTIPYFIGADGGCCDRERVFVDEVRLPVTRWAIQSYQPDALSRIATDAFENGFSYVIIPANSPAHLAFAMHAPEYPDIFLKPVIGWISGVHVDDLATDRPAVVDGRTGQVLGDHAVVLHVEVPADHRPMVQTLNLFRPGRGPALRFAEAGFSATHALIDGQPVALAAHMRERAWDASLPLVADYAGTNINVSIKAVDPVTGLVSFYAPVFPEVDYYQAESVGDYVTAFAQAVPAGVEPVLSCNCILNYLYGRLEGRKVGAFTGPATFGEVAQQLMNQTLVYLVDGNA